MPTFERVRDSMCLPEGKQRILRYGGTTYATDAAGRAEGDSGRTDSFIQAFSSISQGKMALYQLAKPNFVLSSSMDFRSRAEVGDVEGILIDSLSPGTRLNSQRGGFMDRHTIPSSALACLTAAREETPPTSPRCSGMEYRSRLLLGGCKDGSVEAGVGSGMKIYDAVGNGSASAVGIDPTSFAATCSQACWKDDIGIGFRDRGKVEVERDREAKA